MSDTGRIHNPLPSSLRRIVLGDSMRAAVKHVLPFMVMVDRAHLLMLHERGILSKETVRKLLILIERLESKRFAPLAEREPIRGEYLAYENYLIERLGPEVGGALPTARSRNDLGATVLRLRLRRPFMSLLAETLRLATVLTRRAREFADTVLPLYTHYRPAVPSTLGHYFVALATGLERDLRSLLQAGDDLNRCPLGAGAVGGTSLPIDNNKTAALLGFRGPASNSIDAVASRDVVLRLLSAATILWVTLSRLATDILIWSSEEFGFFKLPDSLVGSSSSLPQKTNPFLLEHVQARGASAAGAFASAVNAMQSKPYTNSVAVGTEGVRHAFAALEDVRQSAQIMRRVVEGLRPRPEAMLDRARRGYVATTHLAEKLSQTSGMSFREAHKMMGQIVRQAIEEEVDLGDAASAFPEAAKLNLNAIDFLALTKAQKYGGGPGSLGAQLRSLDQAFCQLRETLSSLRQRHRRANATLSRQVRAVIHDS